MKYNLHIFGSIFITKSKEFMLVSLCSTICTVNLEALNIGAHHMTLRTLNFNHSYWLNVSNTNAYTKQCFFPSIIQVLCIFSIYIIQACVYTYLYMYMFHTNRGLSRIEQFNSGFFLFTYVILELKPI